MKTTIKTLMATATALCSLHAFNATAAVVPTTPDVKLFCAGSELALGAPAAGTEWVVRFSTEQTTTPGTTFALTDGTTVPTTDFTTGYYYISTVGDASNPQICESEPLEVPVYVFEELTVTFNAEDYCFEDAGNQEFTADVQTADAYQSYAYQWYTVVGGVETAIAGATSATYTPDAEIAPNTETTYRLKAGYLVNSLAYCSQTDEDTITVLEKPGKPVITISGVTGETL